MLVWHSGDCTNLVSWYTTPGVRVPLSAQNQILMKNWTEEELEKFVRDNRNSIIDRSKPTASHEIKFMTKLKLRVKNFIDLTPYFVKVAIVTIIVFLCSIIIWNSYIRKDKSKSVIENVIEQFKTK